jgi:apolipoprotein N-acyltransferase
MIHHGHKSWRVIPFVTLAGILTGLSYLFMQSFLAWVCLIPLFHVLDSRTARNSFLWSGLYGVIAASILYYWVVSVATTYSGGFTPYSLLLYGAIVAYFALYCGVFGAGYHFLHNRAKTGTLAGISIAALYVLLELVRTRLLPGSPWCHYTLACSQAQHPWIIQWAAIGGHSIITFTIVFASYIVTQFLRTRHLVHLATGIAVGVCFLAGGFLLGIARDRSVDGRLNATLLNDNTPATMRWNDRTGDSLAHVLFALNREAVRYDPELIVWSETAVPWAYQPDDDFVPTALRITARSQASHLVGAWSPSVQGKDHVHNSAFLINHEGTVESRHDKIILLDLLETPITGGWLSVLPLAGASRYDNIVPGRSQNVIAVGKARIGVLICNESLSEEMYAAYEKAKTNVFIVMSNDAWFEHTPLREHHFYIARMAAVMMGRDILVNSNRGIVGMIRGNGDIEALPPSPAARVVNCVAHLSSTTTLYARVRPFTLSAFAVLACVSLLVRRKHHETRANGQCVPGGRLLARRLPRQRRIREVEMAE